MNKIPKKRITVMWSSNEISKDQLGIRVVARGGGGGLLPRPQGTGTKFLITKFLITKFLITKFLITKFLSNKVPKEQSS
jgi:hypothetical protein